MIRLFSRCSALSAVCVFFLAVVPLAHPADGDDAVPPAGEPDAELAQAADQEKFLERVEIISSYTKRENQFSVTAQTPFGANPAAITDTDYQTSFGLRLFPSETPLPFLEMRHTESWGSQRTRLMTPAGAQTLRTVQDNHETMFAAMLPVGDFGYGKFALYDEREFSSYGAYVVPRYEGAVMKIGHEWANVPRLSDDRLTFAVGTVPYGDWRFSFGGSDRNEGYAMYGPQVGRWIGDFFAAGGYYRIEHDDPAYSLLLGRATDDGQMPSFWLVRLHNPDYRRTNALVAFGSPGVTRPTLNNVYADGVYTSMFTDQMGSVLPIPVRSFEEARLWRRTDEFAQPAKGHRIGAALSLDYLSTDVGYRKWEVRVPVTIDRLGPMIMPHAGPTVEREDLPGVGRLDEKFGVEFGSYFAKYRDWKFFRGGLFYLGASTKTDFDDSYSFHFEVRLNF